MSQSMSISVNGQSQVPPGFRFHPTEEELLHYYLRKKVSYEKIDLDVIRDVDLNKLEPWDIQEMCKIGTTPQNDWYFFSHKDKKYPTGTRTNRATAAGFWKATGRDKLIYSMGMRIGMRKTLVFYKGRAPHGQKSDWIMHEYRLDDNTTKNAHVSNVTGDATQEEGWVVCRIFKKKNHLKTLHSPLISTSSITSEARTQMLNSFNGGSFDQFLEYMGRSSTSCKEETTDDQTTSNNSINIGYFDGFLKLPALKSPDSTGDHQNGFENILDDNGMDNSTSNNQVISDYGLNGLGSSSENMVISNWAALDRLVASQLNGQTMSGYDLLQSNRSIYHGAQDNNNNYNGEIDLWNFTSRLSRTSDHMSNVSD